jgi:hypothetical protein
VAALNAQDLRGFLDQFGLRIEPAVQYLDRSWAVAASADATRFRLPRHFVGRTETD